MEIKKANMDYISKETEEFLGVPFKFNPGNFGSIATARQNTEIDVIYAPVWSDWIDAMFWTAFTTWNNGHEIDLSKIAVKKREQLAINFLKQRPVSAVLESAVFVIKMDNVPRAMTHQIVRHRGMAFNQESYRVTPAHHADFRIPEGLTTDQKDDILDRANESRSLYVRLISDGVPIEQARNVLGMGTCTHIVMTANLKVMQDYIKARTQEIAQDEHTYIVLRIAAELKKNCPEFYDNFFKSEKLEQMMKEYKVE